MKESGRIPNNLLGRRRYKAFAVERFNVRIHHSKLKTHIADRKKLDIVTGTIHSSVDNAR